MNPPQSTKKAFEQVYSGLYTAKFKGHWLICGKINK